jgi:hypothetical protein
MAQSETTAGEVGNPADSNPADAFEAIAAEMLGEEEKQPAEGEDGEEPEATEEAEDDLEIEAEDDGLPPIDPPVSLSAEDKEIFKSLPREGQEIFAKRVGELEKGFHSKAQEAARARQEVEQQAVQQLAAYEADVSRQLSQYAEQLAPQRPNPAMLQHDPQAFYAMQADYEAKVAQQRELQQRSHEFAQQAQQREHLAAQAAHQEQVKVIAEHFPEYLDPTTGPKLQQELSAVARELGYPPELIAEARATDIIAMRKVADLKAKADKYDALQAKKMEKVRAAKGLPKVATPGVPQGAEQTRKARAQAAWEATKSSKGRARDEAFAAYLQSTGQL